MPDEPAFDRAAMRAGALASRRAMPRATLPGEILAMLDYVERLELVLADRAAYINAMQRELDSATERAERAEKERDAILALAVVPAVGEFDAMWFNRLAPFQKLPDMRLFHETREAAVAEIMAAALTAESEVPDAPE